MIMGTPIPLEGLVSVYLAINFFSPLAYARHSVNDFLADEVYSSELLA